MVHYSQKIYYITKTLYVDIATGEQLTKETVKEFYEKINRKVETKYIKKITHNYGYTEQHTTITNECRRRPQLTIFD